MFDDDDDDVDVSVGLRTDNPIGILTGGGGFCTTSSYFGGGSFDAIEITYLKLLFRCVKDSTYAKSN